MLHCPALVWPLAVFCVRIALWEWLKCVVREGFGILLCGDWMKVGDRLAYGPENWADLGENWVLGMAGMRRFRGVWAIAPIFLNF